MKVLVFTTLYPSAVEPNKGTFLGSRTVRLAARPGLEVRVAAPVPYFPAWPPIAKWHRYARVPAEEWRDGVHVLHPRYPVTPKVGMRFYGRALELAVRPSLRRLRRAFPFDVLEAHYLYPDGWAATRIGRRLGVPVVLWARGTDAHSYPEIPAIRRAIRQALRGATRVAAVSSDLARRVEALEPSSRPVAVIPNGVDTSRFLPRDREEARRRLGIAQPGPILLVVGRLTAVKAHGLLLEALASLVGDGTVAREGVRLLVVGEGELRGALERQAGSLGIRECVRFTGEVDQKDLPDWYAAADLHCLPSLREGWPNVLMEAMACGVPSVASRVGGAPEILDGADLGCLVESGSAAAFADGVRAALARDWDRSGIAGRARDRSWERTAEKVEALLRAAVDANPVSP